MTGSQGNLKVCMQNKLFIHLSTAPTHAGYTAASTAARNPMYSSAKIFGQQTNTTFSSPVDEAFRIDVPVWLDVERLRPVHGRQV
jgi:hypothetical protein